MFYSEIASYVKYFVLSFSIDVVSSLFIFPFQSNLWCDSHGIFSKMSINCNIFLYIKHFVCLRHYLEFHPNPNPDLDSGLTPTPLYISMTRYMYMMTSSNGNFFRFTGPLCGEFTGHGWIPLAKASDAERWYFLWSATEKNDWANNRNAGDLRRHRAHYDVIVMICWLVSSSRRSRLIYFVDEISACGIFP